VAAEHEDVSLIGVAACEQMYRGVAADTSHPRRDARGDQDLSVQEKAPCPLLRIALEMCDCLTGPVSRRPYRGKAADDLENRVAVECQRRRLTDQHEVVGAVDSDGDVTDSRGHWTSESELLEAGSGLFDCNLAAAVLGLSFRRRREELARGSPLVVAEHVEAAAVG
jgi:hypothetical protein